MIIVDSQIRAFFDDVLYEKCPDLVAQFQVYEDESWKVPMDLPDFATKALRSAERIVKTGLKQYLELPKDNRPNESWLITKLFPQTLPNSMNANAYKFIFWIITYLLFDPNLEQ
ncbi:hypothetical protein BS50DRAFT_640817 [Corynespora cassiicola Philippines]|uniref:Uncharacterized protein n=1 Tax=Corynespora cassiicola Philippines TaxID=1448308 RepID=A0A2T2N2K6_CORCC|nr:hypothetical protein BS50DRAFT_640817 [Corynespora cassiicola Philippines]